MAWNSYTLLWYTEKNTERSSKQKYDFMDNQQLELCVRVKLPTFVPKRMNESI